MFRKKMKEQLENIFKIGKVTFDEPSENTNEQDCIFVNIVDSRSRARKTQETAKVTGSIRIYASEDKLPFGFFNKAIETANANDTEGFFFYNFDRNEKYYQNLVQREIDFTYLYKAQFDPSAGKLETITLNIGET